MYSGHKVDFSFQEEISFDEHGKQGGGTHHGQVVEREISATMKGDCLRWPIPTRLPRKAFHYSLRLLLNSGDSPRANATKGFPAI